ncbi:MAG: hypothetical protein QJR00_02120 [Bacillota bacterium]|nr:hypothetical protein [Bacillota bacterium]
MKAAGYFLAGLLLGLLLEGGLLFFWVQRDGIHVVLEAEPLREAVRIQIQEEVAQKLPQVLAQVRQQVPEKVAAQVDKELGETTFTLYGVRVDLPASATAGVRQKLKEEITKEFQRELDQLDVMAMATQWADEATVAVETLMRREMGDWSVSWELFPGLTLPVFVDMR